MTKLSHSWEKERQQISSCVLMWEEKDIFSIKFTMQHRMDRWYTQPICWTASSSVHWKKTGWQVRQQFLFKTFSNFLQPENKDLEDGFQLKKPFLIKVTRFHY